MRIAVETRNLSTISSESGHVEGGNEALDALNLG
jgi:hypothetical protein